MSLVSRLTHALHDQGVLPKGAQATIALAQSDTPRAAGRLTRRYVVSYGGATRLSVKLIPRDWPFAVADILRVYSEYAKLEAIRLPRLVAHFETEDGVFLAEEFLPAARSLAQMVEQGEVSSQDTAELLRRIFAEIWEHGRQPGDAFVEREKKRYRSFLRRFVGSDLLADVVADYLARVIDDERAGLRKVLSPGDILDKNIVRSGQAWYLLDFEYAHEALFFFKEAFRSIQNCEWARQFSLAQLCPFLGSFPEPAARLLSLAWESELYALVVDPVTEERVRQSLRYQFWEVFDAGLARISGEQLADVRRQLRDREEALDLRTKEIAARDAVLERLESEKHQLAEASLTREHLLAETTTLAGELETQISRLQAYRQDEHVHVSNLETELAQLRVAFERAQQDARSQAREIDRLEVVRGQLTEESATRQRLVTEVSAHAQELAAQVSRLQLHGQDLQSHAHNLEAELAQLRFVLAGSQEDSSRRAREVDQLEREKLQLFEESATRQRSLAEKSAYASELEQQLSRLQIHRQDVQVHAQNLEAELARVRIALAGAQEDSALRIQQVERLEKERDELTEQDAIRRRAFEEKVVRAEELEDENRRLQASSVRLEMQRQQLADELTEARASLGRVIEEREQQLTEARESLARVIEEREQRTCEINAILNSRSWRLTSKLRELGQGFRSLRGESASVAQDVVDPARTGSASDQLCYFVEQFVATRSPHATRVAVQGWCFAPGSREPVALELRSDGAVLLETRCDEIRDDVAAAHPADLATSSLPRCGFREEIEVDPSISIVELVASASGTVLATASAQQSSGGGDTARRPQFHVEQFRIISHPSGGPDVLEATGWCWAPWSADPIQLELRGDGRTLLTWRCDAPRADVAQAHGIFAKDTASLPPSGFAELCDLEGLSSERFQLFCPAHDMVLAEGTAQQLRTPSRSDIVHSSAGAELGLASLAGRLHRQARAKVGLGTMFSPTKWGQWLRRAIDEFKLYRIETQLVQPTAGAGAIVLSGNSDSADATHPVEWTAPPGRATRVVCFAHNLNLEGATKVLIDVAIGLHAGKQVQAAVVSPFDGPARLRVEESGIACSLLPLPGTANVVAGWTAADDYRASVERVREYLEREKPDVVMTVVLNNFFVIEAAASLGIPSLWLIQESLDRDSMLRAVNPFAVRACERAFFQASYVVFGSRETSELYRRYNRAGNFRVIHNALPDGEIEAASNGGRSEARSRLGIRPEEKVIVTVGTLCRRKDQATLTRALTSLASRRSDVRGYLVGARSGDLYVKMVQRAVDAAGMAERIRLVEETPEVSLYYRAADIFAFASLNECFPLAVLEAMAHGLPIVTTRCIGVSEQVRFGLNAAAFEFGDATALSEELEKLIESDALRAAMGKHSRELLSQLISHDGMIQSYAGLVTNAWQSAR